MADEKEVFSIKEVQDYLQTYVLKNTELTSPKFHITKGSEEGDNYIGIVYRVTIEGVENGKTKKIELFVKTRRNMNEWGDIKDKSSRLFEREIQFYQEILSIFQETVKKHGGNIVRFPFFYGASVELDKQLLIFENLQCKGFVMTKSRILDYQHMSLALRCLGEFHAYSFLTRASNPIGFEKLKLTEHLYEEGDSWLFNEQIKSYFDAISDIVLKALADEDKHYVKRYQQFIDNLDEAMFYTIDAKQAEPYAVVIHGDFWTNNMLFKYDKNKMPCDVRFLDFQISRYASPAIDILHILFMCCESEVRKRYCDQLIRDYYDSLSKYLKGFGYDPDTLFPYDVLSQHLKKFGKYAAGTSTFMIPILFNDGEDRSVENLFSPEALEEKLKTNSTFRNHIKASFKDIIDRNYITILPIFEEIAKKHGKTVACCPSFCDVSAEVGSEPNKILTCDFREIRKKMGDGKEVLSIEEVQNHLRTYVLKDTKLTSPKFYITKGSNEGDNYAGIVYRVTIEGVENGETKKIKLFVKTRRITTEWGDLKDKMSRVFNREIEFYQEIIPIFEETVKKHGRSIVSFPFFYGASIEFDKELLVFEDLQPKGFVMTKSRILDYPHLSVALRRLGEFHAYSFLTRASNPIGFEKLKLKEHLVDQEDNSWLFNDQLESYFKAMRDIVIKALADEDKHYAERYQHFADNLNEIMVYTLDPKQAEPYAVVIHGDFWTNNMLFKYDKDGKPCDVRLLDFQIARYASPAIDILHILFTCCEPKTRKKYYDQLIRDYYDSLSEYLKSFGYDPDNLFPYDVLSQHLKKFSKYGAGIGTFMIPVLFNDGEDKSVQNLFSPESLEERLKTNSTFRNHIKDSFKDMVDRNYL
ncbi:uncharacterized protein LOC109853286 [Pseudomyrmex gracilis]|uniref:uncharacterized protein LOC109853286 n=1 Tax=Pseudomyrmex gracilis TaxID=219809 RepID=UPI0009957F6D|nr:uncharacterized protein LOC109853286 [Pseudomyrmex gracilis]